MSWTRVCREMLFQRFRLTNIWVVIVMEAVVSC